LLAAGALAVVLTSSAVAATLFPDRSFSGDGTKLVGFGRTCCAEPHAIRIEGRDRIVVAGTANTSSGQSETVVVRLLESGRADTSFSGDGRVTLNLAPKPDSFESAFVVIGGGRGRLLVAGRAGETGFILRLHRNGRLDRGFGDNGISRIIQIDGISSAARGAGGRIFVTGEGHTGLGRDALVRLDADGHVDTNFGEEGVVMGAFGSRAPGTPRVAVTDDGRAVIATTVDSPRRLAVTRFLPDGRRDPEFGMNGNALIDLPAASERTVAMAHDPFGRTTVIASAGDGAVGIARLDADGEPDLTFGEAGMTVRRYDRRARFRIGGAKVFPSGVVVVGGSLHAEVGKLAVLRFYDNGAVDRSFGDRGWRVRRIQQRLFAPLMTLQDERPVFAGAEPYGTDGSRAGFRLLRFLAR